MYERTKVRIKTVYGTLELMEVAMRTTIRLDVKVLLYREDEWWIAHCLEMDLPAEGESREEALASLSELIRVRMSVALEEGDLQSVFSPAPPDLWRLYTIAADPPRKQRRAEVTLPAPLKPVDIAVREVSLS